MRVTSSLVLSEKRNPKGPSTQIVGFQGPKTTQSMDFGTYHQQCDKGRNTNNSS